MAIIIAAPCCCGKSYLARSNQYKVYDLDEYIESYVKHKHTEYRDKSAKNKLYVEQINKMSNAYDIILINIGEKLNVLHENNISYFLVYPKNNIKCYLSWRDRDEKRNKTWKWRIGYSRYRELISDLESDTNAIAHFSLNENQYLSDVISDIINYTK